MTIDQKVSEADQELEPDDRLHPVYKQAVALCEALGIEDATRVETAFLRVYSKKYFDDMFTGKMKLDDYIKGSDDCLAKYIGLYLSHYKKECN